MFREKYKSGFKHVVTTFHNKLAALALSPEILPVIRNRTRDYIRKGFPLLQEWMGEQNGNLQCITPEAAAIAFVKYDLNINSTDLAMKLISEASVMIVPGDHFGLDGYMRIKFWSSGGLSSGWTEGNFGSPFKTLKIW